MHTTPGLKSLALIAHSEEQRYRKVTEGCLLLHQGSFWTGAELPHWQGWPDFCRGLFCPRGSRETLQTTKCPKNRGTRACTVYQVTKLHECCCYRPLVSFVEFWVFLISVVYDFNNGMNFV